MKKHAFVFWTKACFFNEVRLSAREVMLTHREAASQ
jgi:hypothetical protein